MLDLEIGRSKAVTNLVMALASCGEARSPVELCVSPLYHYQYSSVTDALTDMAKVPGGRALARQSVQALCMRHFPDSGRIFLQTDTTPIGKAHSPTLPGRTYIAVPNNVIPGNRPLDIGYEVSFVNLSEPATKWSLPLDIERVGADETATERALSQLGRLFAHPALGLSGKLCVNALDSKYGTAAYLSPAWAMGSLVSVVRLRAGMKVWTPSAGGNPRGAPKVYQRALYLCAESRAKPYKRHPATGQPYEVAQPSIFERKPDEALCMEAQTASGRKTLVHLWRWDGLRLRSKGGHNMKDKPFDLLAVKVTDAKSGKALFGQEMYVAISGRRRAEITTCEGCQTYRHRYDIEPHMRFSKQKLLLGKYQTPDEGHFDNWLLCNQLAAWLLYTASDEAGFRPRKWRKYLPENKAAQERPRLSIAQTRHAAQELFLTFDPGPFLPLKSKKGRPRQKGETQIQRTRYEVLKKTSKKAKPPPK
jgi:hypothetical protein